MFDFSNDRNILSMIILIRQEDRIFLTFQIEKESTKLEFSYILIFSDSDVTVFGLKNNRRSRFRSLRQMHTLGWYKTRSGR